MSLYINTRLIGMIAFIMIFTYTAEYAVFAGSTSGGYDSSADLDRYDTDAAPSGRTDVVFEVWIEYQYNRNVPYILSDPAVTAGDNLVGVTLDPYTAQDAVMLFMMHETWKYDNTVFQQYPNGISYFNALPLNGKGAYGIMTNVYTKKMVDNEFKNYLQDLGLSGGERSASGTFEGNVTPHGRGMLESAQYFLGKIPEAIGEAFNLFTFQIKNSYGENIIPPEVIIVMNMFFIPLWIVLTVELLPILALIVSAIGKLLDAITPFT